MKKYFRTALTLSVLVTSTVFLSCDSEDSSNNPYAHAEEFNRKNNVFLKEYPAKVNGNWKVEKMVLTPNTISDIFKTDTILYNVGRISINVIDETHPREPRINMIFNGDFYIHDEIIPFRSSRLLPFADDNFTVGLIEVDPEYFPEPSMSDDQFSEEYHLLNGYFFSDNYEMTLSEDEKTWTWKGLNRSAKEIILTKID